MGIVQIYSCVVAARLSKWDDIHGNVYLKPVESAVLHLAVKRMRVEFC